MPSATTKADVFRIPLNDAMAEFAIDTPPRQAAFLAQIAHESRQLTALEEDFDYRPQELLDTFNTFSTVRFTSKQAELYARTADHPADQRTIADIAYADRGGNGDAASGDGWTYRGAGLLQLKFRDVHEACADHFGIPHGEVGA